MTRHRHAILVALADGPSGAAQREAITTLRYPSESLSAAMRRVLLAAAGRPDLDLAGPDVIARAKLRAQREGTR